MILYIFLDGVGFGENNPEINPFAKFAKGFFLPLAGKPIPEGSPLFNAVYLKTDASMGITGLPQSATGQTSLWTGINAPQAVQRHVSGFPSFTLKKIISKYSMIKVLNESGYKATFLNCYSPGYIQHLESKPRHVSTSTLVQMASRIPFKNVEDLRNNEGLFMDITHEYFRMVARDSLPPNDELLNLKDPYERGQCLGKIAQSYDLSIFEYFITDKIGHKQDWKKAGKVIEMLETFFDGLLSVFDPEKDQIILTSDHGNLEDLSTDVHTANRVPTFLHGKHTDEIRDRINALCDIVPAIYSILGLEIELNQREFVISD